MKKWHLEGIINCSTVYGRKVFLPDENQMYGRMAQAYRRQGYKESAVVSFLRDTVGRVLRRI